MQNNKKHSIVRSGISLSILTIGSRLLGLIREMVKAAFLGTSALGDAFGIAFKIPNLFRRLFAENSVSVAFIPTFQKHLKCNTKQETREFVNATLTLVTFAVTIVVILGMFSSPLLVRVFAGKAHASVIDEMTLLTKIMFPYLLVISIAAFFQGILNGIKIFSPSGFTPILFNICVIASAFALTHFVENPARAMAIGVLLGGIIQASFQLPFVIKNGWPVRFVHLKTAFSNKGTRTVLRLIGPTIIGMAAYQVNDLVSTALAGHAGIGYASSLDYSLRLQELILGIFVVSIGTVILPDLSGFAQKKDWGQFNDLLYNALRIVALICIPVTFFSLITGENMIRLVFQTYNFNENSVALTTPIFKFHILGLLFIALNRILAPAFYAQGNTRLPTIAGISGVIVNLVAAFFLAIPMKGAGIALALSIASLVNTILLITMLHHTGSINISLIVGRTSLYSLKIIGFSSIAATPIYFLHNKIFSLFSAGNRLIDQGIPLIICGLVFAAIGLALLIISKDPILQSLVKKAQNRQAV
ncbi:MAG TPA: murein biosynthesis integral membrane protein MurJ [Treponemataceae bacterium]|nr:murein biosynthesis integral membrane protein MurJ [Treponemataceae bacterium]